ncbi:MAG: alcohol dehydrogenase catalytic domain-containing protein [Gaiellaceae bacterium]|jgi:threonine dehydrogenase-like Zn-dependent dehydrogenase
MNKEKMLAVVCHAPFDYRVQEVDRPSPGPGEILVEVGASGICHSDINGFTGAISLWGEDGSGGFCEAPVIPGHEFAGTVAELGEGAGERHQVALGDRVTAEQIIPCGECRYCKAGHYWMCQPANIFGFKRGRGEGAWAEHMIFPAASRVHKLDERLALGEGAYVEPLACAIHAIDRARIRPGDAVVIGGVGNIGLCALQVAKSFNPGCLIALDTKPDRLVLALELGADVAVNALEGDAPQTVRELSGGYGCDVYIEMSGSKDAVQPALEMTRCLGTVVAFSVIPEPVTLNWSIIGDEKELDLRGSHLGPYCYPRAIEAIAEGRVDVKRLISESYPLAEFPAAMEAARGGNLKTMLIPH